MAAVPPQSPSGKATVAPQAQIGAQMLSGLELVTGSDAQLPADLSKGITDNIKLMLKLVLMALVIPLGIFQDLNTCVYGLYFTPNGRLIVLVNSLYKKCGRQSSL